MVSTGMENLPEGICKWRGLRRKGADKVLEQSNLPTARATWLKHVWRTINVALVSLECWAGYDEMAPAKLWGTNPDQYFA
jgi:hypothetical protein